MAFADDLTKLMSRELAAASQARDDERSAMVVAELAAALGAAIAIITEGDPQGIELMLRGAENMVATTAAEKAPMMRAIVSGSKGASHGR